MELWRDITDYKGTYQVSNLGRVRSIDRIVIYKDGKRCSYKGRIRRLCLCTGGYYHVGLRANGDINRTKAVHRLVAKAWLGPCPEGQQVCHGLNGKLDNSVSNLSYGTSSKNCLDKRRDGTDRGCPVRRSDGKEFINMTVAAEEMGCSRRSICATCNGRIKTIGGFGWKRIYAYNSRRQGRPIRRSDGKEFNSIAAAAKETGCSRSIIWGACNGITKTAAGFGWEYI